MSKQHTPEESALIEALLLMIDGMTTYAPDFMHGLPKRDYLDQAHAALNLAGYVAPECEFINAGEALDEMTATGRA